MSRKERTDPRSGTITTIPVLWNVCIHAQTHSHQVDQSNNILEISIFIQIQIQIKNSLFLLSNELHFSFLCAIISVRDVNASPNISSMAHSDIFSLYCFYIS